MLTYEQIQQIIGEMESAFHEIQMPRSPFVLQHFVVGQHDTAPQQYAQCVLEMQIKWEGIRRARIQRRRLDLEIEHIETEITYEKDEHKRGLLECDFETKRIDLEELERALMGAIREFEALYTIWQAFPQHYTREELDAAQPEYWARRLERQARLDQLATGRVGVGNLEALLQIGRSPYPELDHARDVERRYLDTGDRTILIGVATQEKAVNGLKVLEELAIPTGIQIKSYNVWGRAIDEAYNEMARTALEDGAHFLLSVEDDTFPPGNGLFKLLNLYEQVAQKDAKVIVGGWYLKRQKVREGAPIIIQEERRRALDDDGQVHECYTLPCGFTLFPVQVFRDTLFPWFKMTAHLTQDSFFSQQAREAGYTLLCDTAIKCKHVDRVTGEIFE